MRYVVVTGGSSGIGDALVKLFSNNGDKVISLDIKEPSIKAHGVIYKSVDIRNIEEIENAIKGILNIDILINNAAVQYINPLKKLDNKHIIDMIDTNILGTINVTKTLIPYLKDGLIINVGSVHSSVARENKIPYDMSKAALSIFTKEIALELSNQSTRSICVEFGAVKTPMNNDFVNKQEKESALSKQVINHLMTSEECAEIIYELTTDKYKFMNGSVVTYDCGRSLK